MGCVVPTSVILPQLYLAHPAQRYRPPGERPPEADDAVGAACADVLPDEEVARGQLTDARDAGQFGFQLRGVLAGAAGPGVGHFVGQCGIGHGRPRVACAPVGCIPRRARVDDVLLGAPLFEATVGQRGLGFGGHGLYRGLVLARIGDQFVSRFGFEAGEAGFERAARYFDLVARER